MANKFAKTNFLRRLINILTLRKIDIPEDTIRTKIRVPIVWVNFLLKKPVKKRYDLLTLSRFYGLKGIAAEIGVATGKFSDTILRNSDFSVLYSIDPWKEFSDDDYSDSYSLSQEKQEDNYKEAIGRLEIHKERSRIIRLSSAEAVAVFTSATFDFIYIDGNHKYDACRQDLKLWWPKLKKGGIFAGHDYLCKKLSKGEYGVKQAVDEFIKDSKQTLHITKEEYPTWYIVKM